MSVEALLARLQAHGQEHLLRWWTELAAGEQESLCRQIESIDLELTSRLFRDAQSGALDRIPLEGLKPASYLRLAAEPEDWERQEQAAARGEQALAAGRVAVILVAGGHGTRLGHDGPKGTLPIGPVSGKSLFQIHAEKVRALSRRHGQPIRLYVMTSLDNDQATRQFFDEHHCFGLEPGQVTFFVQRDLPAFDRDTGKILLAARSSVAMSPNGHGGVVEALARSGCLEDMRGRQVGHVFYFQVDNPLTKVADPIFLGQHLEAAADVSLKIVRKRDAAEKLGVLVEKQGKVQIVEYSDLPRELAERRLADGRLEFDAGSIAVHFFEREFLERLAAASDPLPYHRAFKSVSCLDASGQAVQGKEPNALKFEMFIFDALPLARRVLAVETSRREEFEPVKNAEGSNSPMSARQAMSDLYADWLRLAGVEVARRPDGSAAVPVEIGPLFALDAEELRDKVEGLGVVDRPLLLDV